MFNNGVKLIQDQVAQFEKTKLKLQQGIELCKEQTRKNTEKIALLESETLVNTAAIQKAETVVQNLNKILGV